MRGRPGNKSIYHSCCEFCAECYHMERWYVFSIDQAALRTLISVCPSVCLSVRPSVTPFWQCFSHRTIPKISGVFIIDRRDVHAKGQCQRSKVKVTEVMTPFSRFQTITLFAFTYGDGMMHKAWCCLEYEPYCFSRSSVNFKGHTTKKHGRFWPIYGLPGF